MRSWRGCSWCSSRAEHEARGAEHGARSTVKGSHLARPLVGPDLSGRFLLRLARSVRTSPDPQKREASGQVRTHKSGCGASLALLLPGARCPVPRAPLKRQKARTLRGLWWVQTCLDAFGPDLRGASGQVRTHKSGCGASPALLLPGARCPVPRSDGKRLAPCEAFGGSRLVWTLLAQTCEDRPDKSGPTEAGAERRWLFSSPVPLAACRVPRYWHLICAQSGKRTRTVVPLPGSLSNSIGQRKRSDKRLTMVRPTPWPPRRPCCARKKG